MKSRATGVIKKAVRRKTKLRSTIAPTNVNTLQSTKSKSPHVSVLLSESVSFLRPTPPNLYIDGTLGAGGHSKAIAEAMRASGIPGGKLFSFDCDASAFVVAKPILDAYPDIIVPVASRFSRMHEILDQKHGVKAGSIDGILLDLGVSSMQLDRKDRGFAYRFDGPLDMRMDQNSKQATAADYVNKLNADDLSLLLSHFGIHKLGLASKVALGIIEKRKEIIKFETTKQLLEVLESLFPMGNLDLRKKMIKTTFQAFRIMVNDEHTELKRSLLGAEQLLRPHGKLGIISFQSDEASILKKFISTCTGKRKAADIIMEYQTNVKVAKVMSRFGHALPQKLDSADLEKQANHIVELAKRRPSFVSSDSRSVSPSNSEVEQNPRANSALLHCEVRSIHPPLGFGYTWF